MGDSVFLRSAGKNKKRKKEEEEEVEEEEETLEERRKSLAKLSLRQVFQHSIDAEDLPR